MSERRQEIAREILEGTGAPAPADEMSKVPEALENVGRDGEIAIAHLDGALNLNAIAIGLGLENITYEPEQFPGLVYNPGKESSSALLFANGTILAPDDKSGDPAASIELAIERIVDLGLYTEDASRVGVTTERIADAISG